MKPNLSFFDCIIVGGGASGIFAAMSVRLFYPHYNILLVEKNSTLGKKILVTGSGRCNLTNENLANKPSKHFNASSKNLTSNIFDQFSYRDIREFFKDLGIETFTEAKGLKGKVYPQSNQAGTVKILLEKKLKQANIEIKFNTILKDIKQVSNIFEVTLNTKTETSNVKEVVNCKNLILATGGKSYPALGADGSGFALATSLGHKIIQPVPAAVSLNVKSSFCSRLQGVKFPIEVSCFLNNKKTKTVVDDVLFTRYGLSGTAILEISREISVYLNRNLGNKVNLTLNFLPNFNQKDLINRFIEFPNYTLEEILLGFFPVKFPKIFLEELKINPHKVTIEVPNNELQLIVDKLFAYNLAVTSTRGWNEAEFTAGGVEISEINDKTLESKLVNNLYFCGEILDVDGEIGGFNLSWAWASGFVAGKLGN